MVYQTPYVSGAVYDFDDGTYYPVQHGADSAYGTATNGKSPLQPGFSTPHNSGSARSSHISDMQLVQDLNNDKKTLEKEKDELQEKVNDLEAQIARYKTEAETELNKRIEEIKKQWCDEANAEIKRQVEEERKTLRNWGWLGGNVQSALEAPTAYANCNHCDTYKKQLETQSAQLATYEKTANDMSKCFKCGLAENQTQSIRSEALEIIAARDSKIKEQDLEIKKLKSNLNSEKKNSQGWQGMLLTRNQEATKLQEEKDLFNIKTDCVGCTVRMMELNKTRESSNDQITQKEARIEALLKEGNELLEKSAGQEKEIEKLQLQLDNARNNQNHNQNRKFNGNGNGNFHNNNNNQNFHNNGGKNGNFRNNGGNGNSFRNNNGNNGNNGNGNNGGGGGRRNRGNNGYNG